MAFVDGQTVTAAELNSINAATATALQTPRAINGVNFDGTADITIPLTGAVLAADLASTTDMTKGVSEVGGAGRVVASIAALRTLPKTGSPEAFATGYYVQGDGGGGAYWYDSTDTTTADNGGTVIVASDGGRWKLGGAIRITTRLFGCKGDGTTDDSAAFASARAAAVLLGVNLYISGTLLISAQQTISTREHWVFEGAQGNYAANFPISYLIKAASMTTPLVMITAQGAIIEGGGFIGQTGNTNDGVQILGNTTTLRGCYINGMGNDGVRIGNSTTYYNSDSFLLDGIVSSNNGRHGINIDGQPATTDANAGLILKPLCQSNGGNGINSNYAKFGNTIVCPLLEANAGYGLYLETNTSQTVIIGGDIEANTITAQIYEGTQFANRFIDVTITGLMYNNRLVSSTFSPSVAGASSSGTATYSIRAGSYSVEGARVSFEVYLVWSAHTGTGQMTVPLPFTAQQTNPVNAVALPRFIPCTFWSEGIAVTSPAQPAALIDTTVSVVNLYTNNAGTLTAFPMASSGQVHLSGSFTMVQNLSY